MSDNGSFRLNRFRRSILLGMTAFLTGNCLVMLLSKAKAFGVGVAAPTPYTVKLRSVVSDGSEVRRELGTFTFAVRSDGSRAMVSTLPHPNGIETTRNIEFANGDRATVGDLIGKRTTWKSKSTPIVARWHRDPAQQCMKTLAGTAPTTAKEWNIGNGSVNGIRFVTIERGSGTYSYALDFGCAQVASKTGFGANTSGHELIGLIPGEPDATLFHVPPEFEETDPLAFAQAMRASMRLGPLPEACERKTRDYADIYRKQ